MSSRMDFGSPFRNRYVTSVLPIVYPALLHSSSNFEMYSLISGAFILRDYRATRALSAAWVSVYCWANSSRNDVHSSPTSSVSGFSLSRAAPMFFTHLATFSPYMRVRARFIFCIADSNPGTHQFKWMYVFIASMKFPALARSPVKGSRSAPIILTSPCRCGTCCGAVAGP